MTTFYQSIYFLILFIVHLFLLELSSVRADILVHFTDKFQGVRLVPDI